MSLAVLTCLLTFLSALAFAYPLMVAFGAMFVTGAVFALLATSWSAGMWDGF